MSNPRFTDEDLKRLQDICNGEYLGLMPRPEEVLRLIARLEAAENCAELLKLHQESGIIYDGDEEDNALALQAVEAWRKAKGE